MQFFPGQFNRSVFRLFPDINRRAVWNKYARYQYTYIAAKVSLNKLNKMLPLVQCLSYFLGHWFCSTCSGVQRWRIELCFGSCMCIGDRHICFERHFDSSIDVQKIAEKPTEWIGLEKIAYFADIKLSNTGKMVLTLVKMHMAVITSIRGVQI